jgi:hypothetical protein
MKIRIDSVRTRPGTPDLRRVTFAGSRDTRVVAATDLLSDADGMLYIRVDKIRKAYGCFCQVYRDEWQEYADVHRHDVVVETDADRRIFAVLFPVEQETCFDLVNPRDNE